MTKVVYDIKMPPYYYQANRMKLDEMISYAMKELKGFEQPPTAKVLVEALVKKTSMDNEHAQRATRAAIDRGLIKPGSGLKLEIAM